MTNKELIAVLFIILLMAFAICHNSNSDASNMNTVTIEEHDYFKISACGFTYTLCHKGNCKKCVTK